MEISSVSANYNVNSEERNDIALESYHILNIAHISEHKTYTRLFYTAKWLQLLL
jgi:hypothetical protein